jgi:hypothetical protein
MITAQTHKKAAPFGAALLPETNIPTIYFSRNPSFSTN